MKNRQSTIINRPRKAYRSTNTAMSQNGIKKVTKVRSGCCMGGSLKK